MKQIIFFGVLLSSLNAKTQYLDKTKYRFKLMLGSQSMAFWKKEFQDVDASDHYYDVIKYEKEVYEVSYKEISRSKEISLGFAINWIVEKNWRVEQQFIGSVGTFTETINHRITDIGNGDTLGTKVGYTKAEIPLGYKSKGYFFGQQITIQTNALFIYEWDNGLGLGTGFNYTYIEREGNSLVKQSGYLPLSYPRALLNYKANYFGFSVYLEKKWERIGLNLVLGQEAFSIKNEEIIKPTDMNFHSRLPFTWNIGLAINFDEIKK